MKTLFNEEVNTGDVVLFMTNERTGSSTKSRVLAIGRVGEHFRKVDVDVKLFWIENSYHYGQVKVDRYASSIIKVLSDDELENFNYSMGIPVGYMVDSDDERE